ncbi:MAG: hypothetical protein IJH09_01425 [Clostridia bacterium]|nr:hypothetical protein [Clostridia bacterium]
MRRMICTLIALALLMSVWTVQAETGNPVPYTFELLDYTTMVDPTWRPEWEEGVGLYFHFDEDNMPYILVQPSASDDRITDGEAFLKEYLPQLQDQYLKNGAVSTSLHGSFRVAGRSVAAGDVQYRNNSGLKIYYLIVVDVHENHTVVYRIRYLDESQRQQMLDGLELIASGYTFRGEQVGLSVPQPQPQQQQPVPYACEEGGFTAMIEPSWRMEWVEGDGLYCHFGDDNMPYILVRVQTADDRIADGDAYLTDALRDIEALYEKNGAVSTMQHGSFSVAGRPVAAADIQYRNGSGVKICMMVVVDVREDFSATYIVRYLDDSQRQEMLDGLDLIASGLQPYGQSNPAVEISELRRYNAKEAPSIVPSTTQYTCAEFTATIPAGWTVEKGGLFESFSYRCYDPKVPERCLFLMSQAGLMHKSQAGKNWWINSGTGPSIQKPLVDAAMVLPEPSISCFVQNMENFRASLEVAYPMHLSEETLPPEVVPDINDAEIWEVSTSAALEEYIKAMSRINIYNTFPDASVVRFGCFSSRGTPCEGMAGGVVLDCLDPFYQNPTLDVWFYFPCCFMGFTAPMGELQALEPTLASCLNSFRFTDSYIRLAQQSGQIIADLIDLSGNWARRDQSYDVISQKYSDATLGFDRLYDSETGEVYRADLDFYDSYDLHRGEYSNPNLVKIDDSTSSYYLEPVDYYIVN